MKKILNLKHWQLFILIVLTGAWTSPSPLQEIIRFIGLTTFLIWIYSIGIYGQIKLESLKLPTLKTKLFKLNIVAFPILLLFLGLISPERNYGTELSFLEIILIPFGIYMFFALIYSVVFACKTITMIELKKEVNFSDYLGNFLLMLFLIIGIWILQPKITKLIAETKHK